MVKDGTKELTRCRETKISYKYTCKKCMNEGKIRSYEGESARNLYCRSKETYQAMLRKDDSSWRWKHIKTKHNGNLDVEFNIKVVGKFTN